MNDTTTVTPDVDTLELVATAELRPGDQILVRDYGQLTVTNVHVAGEVYTVHADSDEAGFVQDVAAGDTWRRVRNANSPAARRAAGLDPIRPARVGSHTPLNRIRTDDELRARAALQRDGKLPIPGTRIRVAPPTVEESMLREAEETLDDAVLAEGLAHVAQAGRSNAARAMVLLGQVQARQAARAAAAQPLPEDMPAGMPGQDYLDAERRLIGRVCDLQGALFVVDRAATGQVSQILDEARSWLRAFMPRKAAQALLQAHDMIQAAPYADGVLVQLQAVATATEDWRRQVLAAV